MSKKVKTLYSFLALQFLLPAYRCTCHLEASQSTTHIQSVSVQKHSLGTYRQGQAMRRLPSAFSASGISGGAARRRRYPAPVLPLGPNVGGV